MRNEMIRIAALCSLAVTAYACSSSPPGGRPPVDSGTPSDAEGLDARAPGIDTGPPLLPGDDAGAGSDAGPGEDGGPGSDAGPGAADSGPDGGPTTSADGGPIARCGDGMVSGTETCDPAIAAGSPGACPTSCNDGIACTTDTLAGAASSCDARCTTTDLTTCAPGDSCCPAGCTTAADADCSCVPRTACGAGECGTVDNGCGGALTCPACTIGGACTTDADCSGTDVCVTEIASGWPGGFCTSGCMTDADCGSGSHCAYRSSSASGLCVANCTTSADCRAGYSCRNDDLSVPASNECAPIASGTGAVGAPCTSTSMCGGGDAGLCIVEAGGWQGGYCSRECRMDAQCPGGSHCTVNDGVGDGLCVANCTGASSCRAAGYSCADFDGDARTECVPSATGTAPVGASCDATFECSGGRNGLCVTDAQFADGYCTIVNCTSAADCPAGSHCTIFGTNPTGFCAANCTSDASCRSSGYACFDANADGTNECYIAGTGTGAVGSPCDLTNQCAGGGRGLCATEGDGFRDGYCVLNGCVAGGTGATGCPTGSHCSIQAGASTGFCVDDCASDADCRADGYRCFDRADVDATSECWIAGTGTGSVGDPCAGSWDCAGEELGLCIPPQGGRFAGGYCSLDCGGASCPAGSSCIAFTGGAACLDNCVGAGMGDCRSGYTCGPPAAGLPNVCF